MCSGKTTNSTKASTHGMTHGIEPKRTEFMQILDSQKDFPRK